MFLLADGAVAESKKKIIEVFEALDNEGSNSVDARFVNIFTQKCYRI